MSAERCMCGATDCPICGPLQGYSRNAKPTPQDFELALENVVECILDHGSYPAKGLLRFDLYEFLAENRDPSFFLEMYVAALSDNRLAFGDRIERERASVEAILINHLTGSDMVSDLAHERAAEDE